MTGTVESAWTVIPSLSISAIRAYIQCSCSIFLSYMFISAIFACLLLILLFILRLYFQWALGLGIEYPHLWAPTVFLHFPKEVAILEENAVTKILFTLKWMKCSHSPSSYWRSQVVGILHNCGPDWPNHHIRTCHYSLVSLSILNSEKNLSLRSGQFLGKMWLWMSSFFSSIFQQSSL